MKKGLKYFLFGGMGGIVLVGILSILGSLLSFNYGNAFYYIFYPAEFLSGLILKYHFSNFCIGMAMATALIVIFIESFLIGGIVGYFYGRLRKKF